MKNFKAITTNCWPHVCLLVLCLGLTFNAYTQELGYNLGLNKLGIRPSSYQPLYGFSIGYQFNKYSALETNLIYSQRSKEAEIQADYFSFILMPKLGYSGKRAGVYFAPGLILNPTLHHSNIENHTYLSCMPSLAIQYRILPKLIVDVKMGYDIGLTGAYYENQTYQTYSGPVLLLGMKVDFGKSK